MIHINTRKRIQKLIIGLFFIFFSTISFSQDFKSIASFSKTVAKVGYYYNDRSDELYTSYIELYYYLGNLKNEDLSYKVIICITTFSGKMRYDLCFYSIENDSYYQYKCELLEQLPIAISDKNLVFFDNKKVEFSHQNLSKVFNTPYGESIFPQ